VLEWGPQRARRTSSFNALVDELGLAGRLVEALAGLPLYVYAAGRLRKVPFSISEFLATDLLDLRAKARVLAEPLTGPPRDDESVAQLFIRKVGSEAYERLVGPLYGGLYASDPAQMIVGLSLRHVLREFGIGRSFLARLVRGRGRVAPPAACTFDEGLQVLTDALYERNAGRIRLSTPAAGLELRTGKWTIVTPEDRAEVETVVLTCPAPAAAALLEPVAPRAADRIKRLVYNPLAVVHLYAETDLAGLGYQVAQSEDLVTRGVTWNDAMFGRDGVYTAYLGGARRPEIVQLEDRQIGEIAVREFHAVTGHNARPISVGRERMPAWDRSWAALEDLVLPKGIVIAANWWSRPGIPGRLADAARTAREISGGAAGSRGS
jgi:oxygen-dependent protoporphyrinogen oxidase